MDCKPIIVSAHTRDPEEECFCTKCNTQLVRKGNKLVCPNGCACFVLILPLIKSDTHEDTTMIQKNFIKPLPKGENAAVDESLLWLQVRVRKGTSWEQALRYFIEEADKDHSSIASDTKRMPP